ncbi:glycosyltransferase family 2 protein [Wolfiporia cocos MD-104 SS10]|uniref:Chitin synthase n=1 Tax=Wolfiporia cocos (strain MD-104) TaxID=742152 RepID=A0A2H3JN82_WOLCO|nr:glycosyltransferase family 2 protein [Wolfiporia cocos MD-104 SS10]
MPAGPSDSPSRLSHRQSRIAVRNPSLPPLFEATGESSAGDRGSLSTFSSTTALPPLDWEKRQSTYSEDGDPFVDYETPVPRLGGDQYQAAPGLAYENARNSRHSLSTSGHSTSTLAPNHTGYYSTSPLSIPPSICTTHTGYSHSRPDGSSSYGTPYSPVDHFRYHTEAHGSAVHSHAASQAPCSRSLTPTPDDEYHITGTGDMHGAQYSPRRSPGSYDYFDYKEHLQTRLQGTNGSDGYLHPHADPEKSLASNASSPYPEPPETPVRRHFGPAPPRRILLPTQDEEAREAVQGKPRRRPVRAARASLAEARRGGDAHDAEDEVLFCWTLYGVMQNISHLSMRKNSRMWGPDAWKKDDVHRRRHCVVADGHKKIRPRVLDRLTLLGVYRPGDHMKDVVDNKPVTAHLFEHTATFGLDPNLHFRYPDKGVVPTQILFCMKEKNINSHRWFFNAFGKRLQAGSEEYISSLKDVRPRLERRRCMWACGEIAAYKDKHWPSLLNPLVSAQNFEYKIANFLDKPTESLFGYISVLPGAFSAYRYIALQNDKQGCGPLASYSKGEVLHGRDTNIFSAWLKMVLRYVKSVSAETDVPDALPEFIGQRRRCSTVPSLTQLMRSHIWARFCVRGTAWHERYRQSWRRSTISSIWSQRGLLLATSILTSSLENDSFGVPGIQYFNAVVQFVMGSIVVACFLFSMGNRPRASKWKCKLSAILLSCLLVYMIACAVFCAIRAARSGGTVYNTMVSSVVITYGVYVLSSLLALDLWHIFRSFIPYLLLSPTYINILNVYAFCNLDDISWGTKQDTEMETDLGAATHDSNAGIEFEVPSDVALEQDVPFTIQVCSSETMMKLMPCIETSGYPRPDALYSPA